MSQNEKKINLTNELAKERNREAADRTLMAWTRTAISLIGIGFAIAQAYEYFESDYVEKTGRVLDALRTPLIFGGSFIVLGMLGLVAGVIQYGRVVDRITSDSFTYTGYSRSPQIMAIILLIIGLFGFIAILI